MAPSDRQMEHIEGMLDRFDWEAVKKAMAALDWTWHRDPEPPRYNELRRVAKSLLVMVADHPDQHTNASTGGFEASKEEDFLALAFTVVEESNEDDLEKDVIDERNA